MVFTTITNVSFLIFAIASFTLSSILAYSLIANFELKAFLKAAGLAILGFAFFLNFLSHSFSQITVWLLSISFFLISLATVTDKHSKLRLTIIINIFVFFFLKNHNLLFVQALLIAITTFQLIYTPNHRNLIPFGIGALLVTLGEYFYSFESSGNLMQIVPAGSFLYLFASLVIFAWILYYLIRQIVNLMR